MGRAEDLYRLVVNGGKDAIDQLINDRISEELYLDFKQAATPAGSRSLHDSDLKNLAKAISGFGNSAGGLIVWGVDCRQQKDGADVAGKLVPVEDAAQFRSLIEGRISGLTLPIHAGVINYVIPIDSGPSGYVATLIPEADNMPIQALNQMRYYMRAGSNFEPVLHSVLAGMFGRRPNALVQIEVEPIPAAQNTDGTTVTFASIAIRNTSSVVATGIYLTADVHNPEHSDHAVLVPEDRRIGFHSNYREMHSVICTQGTMLPPGDTIKLLDMRLRYSRMVAGELEIRLAAGTTSGPPTHLSLRVSENKLNHSLKLAGLSHVDKKWLGQRMFGLTDD